MRHSIRVRITVIMAAMIAATIGICVAFNFYFLEEYYKSDKKNTLIEAYEELNTLMLTAGENMDQAVLNTLGALSERGNISALILDDEGRARYASSRDVQSLIFKLQGYVLNQQRPTVLEELYHTELYQINLCSDISTESNNLESWGFLQNGYIFIMTMPLESIKESVAVSGRFFLYVGIGVAAIAMVIMYFISKSITKPVLKLAAISESMSRLDFDVRYEGKEKDEIGVLGQAMNHMSEELETTITKLKTANEQLKKDIEEKIQIDDMRKEFLSNVSHELKTPIALIQGYAEGLKEGISDDPESREFYCEVICDEAAKMNQMVKKLLNLNHLEFGSQEISPDDFDFMELLKGTLHSADILSKQKNVEIAIDGPEGLMVRGDEFMIEEVIRNYVSNALNHVKDVNGRRLIKIGVTSTDTKAHISVYNSGQPIPEESLDKVWIKFYKVDKARTREYGGSGIGLSIVKAIMDAHKNAYGVSNRPEGVEFWFELDLV